MAETVIVAIRASAGGVQALKILASGLASDFAGAVLITLDVSPASPRLLPEIMRAAGPLTVRYAQHGDEIEPAHIYIAPPDRHMLLEASGRLMRASISPSPSSLGTGESVCREPFGMRP